MSIYLGFYEQRYGVYLGLFNQSILPQPQEGVTYYFQLTRYKPLFKGRRFVVYKSSQDEVNVNLDYTLALREYFNEHLSSFEVQSNNPLAVKSSNLSGDVIQLKLANGGAIIIVKAVTNLNRVISAKVVVKLS